MSYSFNAKGPTKQAALVDATEKLDAMIAQQGVHMRDREVALNNLSQHLGLLREPDADEDVSVNMHGSIWVENFGATALPERINQCGAGCSVHLVKRPAVAA